MKVIDSGDRIFSCSAEEKGAVSIISKNTAFGINYAFDPPVVHSFNSDGNNGEIEFTVVRDTRLIINFNYSDKSGGSYKCGLTTIEEDPDGTFSETVKQFGPLPQKRIYKFFLET